MTTWGRLLATTVAILAAPAMAQGPAGDWLGTLAVGNAKLRLVVHIKQGAAGELTGTMDSPDQGAMGIPISAIAREEDRLAFTASVGAQYSGKWDARSKTWKGEWRQGGGALPLDFAAPPPPAALPANWQIPADAEIRKLIADRIAPRPGEGIAIGVIEPQGRRIVTGGPVQTSTEFEIGSLSKVFTGLILADMAAKGEVSLDDPAEKYLPAGAHLPERGRKITLRDLSMHRSGLPRLPDNMAYADPEDPYADYTEAQMLVFLGRYQLTRDVGATWDYSNLGVGLLGYLLGRAAHKPYAELLHDRITGPLGMTDTAIMLSPEQTARFAIPYDGFGRRTKPWRLPTLVGAGGIRSTAPDMLKFAAAVIDPQSPLAPAMKVALSELGQHASPRGRQALGWAVFHIEPGHELLMHDGGTGGFRSFLAIEPSSKRAVLVLANSAAEPSGGDMASHILIGAPIAPTPPLPPAPPPPGKHIAVTLPVAELDRVVGRYDFGNGILFAITRSGDTLMVQRQGAVTGEMLPLFAEAPLKFFLKAIDAQMAFTVDRSGKVGGASFATGGQSLSGKKIY